MAKRRRNVKRKWIWIGTGAAVVLAIGTVVIVRRRGALPSGGGDGGSNGAGGPDDSRPWYIRYRPQLHVLCTKPKTLTEQDRTILMQNIFLPAWRSYRAQHVSPTPGPQELEDAFKHVAESVLDQACQVNGPGSLQEAAELAKGAFYIDEGTSGQ